MIQVICCKHVHDMGHEFCLIVDGVQDESLKLFRETILEQSSLTMVLSFIFVLHCCISKKWICRFAHFQKAQNSRHIHRSRGAAGCWLSIPSTCCCLMKNMKSLGFRLWSTMSEFKSKVLWWCTVCNRFVVCQSSEVPLEKSRYVGNKVAMQFREYPIKTWRARHGNQTSRAISQPHWSKTGCSRKWQRACTILEENVYISLSTHAGTSREIDCCVHLLFNTSEFVLPDPLAVLLNNCKLVLLPF